MLSLEELRLKQTLICITAERYLHHAGEFGNTSIGRACKREACIMADQALGVGKLIVEKEREETIYNFALAEALKNGIDQRFCWVAGRDIYEH